MSTPRLRQRLPTARVHGQGKLLQHQLKFHKVSDIDGSGKCDAYPTGVESDVVHGVLFDIEAASLTVLDRIEGNGKGYRRARVRVKTSETWVTAVTYHATVFDHTLQPMDWYHHHVVYGAREHALPQSYINQIEQVTYRLDEDRDRAQRELAIYLEPISK